MIDKTATLFNYFMAQDGITMTVPNCGLLKIRLHAIFLVEL